MMMALRWPIAVMKLIIDCETAVCKKNDQLKQRNGEKKTWHQAVVVIGSER